MNYYPHHIGDFNNATRHLTRVERSLYRDMIELYYDTEQPLTLDVPALCRKLLARTDEEATAVQQLLNEFFTKTEQGWHHERCEIEIKAFHANTTAKSAAGKASAAKREAERLKRLQELNNSSTAVQHVLDSVDSSVQLTSNQEPVTNNQIEEQIPPNGVSELPKRKNQGTTLQTFLANCEKSKERPMRDYAPLWKYAKEANLESDFVVLAWVEFVRRFGKDGAQSRKLYTDWRGAFRKYVEGNFLKLWAIDKSGAYYLTTEGKQAQKVHDSREAA